MKYISRSIKIKLTILILTITLVPIFALGFLAYQNFQKSLEKEAFVKLEAIGEIKANWIKNYFEERFGDLHLLANTPLLHSLLSQLEDAYQASGKSLSDFVNSSKYETVNAKVNSYLQPLEATYGYYNVFLISHDGDILYTVKHEADFGTNVRQGKYSNSNLARLAKQILDGKKEGFVDFEHYQPSNNAPASFIAHAIYDDKKNIHGLLALQISTDQLNAVMQEGTGMGKTGETYLVGSDFLMRSDSRLESESTILKEKVDTEGTRKAFSKSPDGKTGEIHKNLVYKDYHGALVLGYSTYIKQFDWTVIAEIDKAETDIPALRIRKVMFSSVFLLSVISVIVTVLVSNKLASPIRKLSSTACEIAEGDLSQTTSIKSNDEIGLLADSFATMIKGLRTAVAKIQEASKEMTAASSEILSASHQQAAGARQQSAAVSETTSAAIELSKSAEQVGEKIKIVAETANHTLNGMGKIKDVIGKTGQVVLSLSEKSEKIGQITELIDDVADQTNLLAVNAAIEAARAGEQGKGFTVVADEIRKLADSTAKSAKDISTLIEIVQHEMSNVTTVMEESLNSVDEEINLAKESAERSREISTTTNQQVIGSKQIAGAMDNINDAMKQVAEGAQQSQVAAKQLTHLAEELNGTVSGFRM